MTDTLYFLLQALVEFGESKKILPVAGITLSEALPPIQRAFDIPVGCDILVQQYDPEWDDFIDLETTAVINNRAKLRLLKKVLRLL